MKGKGKLHAAIVVIALLFVCALAMTACNKKKKETTPIVSLTLDSTSLTLEMGYSADIGYTTNFDGKVTAEYDDTKISVFVLEGTKTLHVIPLAVGETSVTVRAGTASAVCAVTVNSASSEVPSKVEIDKELTMTFGITSPVALSTKTMLNGEPAQLDVTYYAAPEGVVTVSADGVVTAVSVGKAVITAVAKKDGYPDAVNTCAVRVLPDADIIFDRPEYTLFLQGDTTVTPAIELFENDLPVADTSRVEFTSGNANIISVDKTSGEITAQAMGKTYVMASWKGLDISVPVEVFDKVVIVNTKDQLADMSANNYYKLATDLEFDFTANSANSNQVIDTLNATLDGNGHNIVMNVVTGDANPNVTNTPDVHFVKTIGEKGVIKNTHFEYSHSTVSNTQNVTMFADKNNGVIKDCEFEITYSPYWHYYDLNLLTRTGNGSVKNLVVNVTITGGYNEGQIPYGGEAKLGVYGTNTANNVLLVLNKDRKFDVPEGAQNVTRVSGINDFPDSGFMTVDFYMNKSFSFWKSGLRDEPSFTAYVEYNVDIATIADITSAVTQYGNDAVINFNLTADISYSGTGDRTLIPELKGVFSGNGHKITIDVTIPAATSSSLRELLIGTIADTGTVQDLCLEYTLKTNGNAYHTVTFVATNNGVIRNCEMKVTYKPGWQITAFSPLGTGTGTLENVIFNLDIPDLPAMDSKKISISGSIFKNALIITNAPNLIEVASDAQMENAVIIKSAKDFATSGFDTTPFDINGANSYWKSDYYNIPSFTAYVEYDVNVASVNDIVAALTQYGNDAAINFNLTQDVTYTGTEAATLIPVLKGVFNGNGHKITITANFAETPSETKRLLIAGTIAETGTVQNLCLEYTLTVNINAYHTVAFFANNNGTIRNCEIKVTYKPGWHVGGNFAPLGNGNGTLENVVLNVQIPDKGVMDTGANAKKIHIGGSTFKNVLVITNMPDRIEADSNVQRQNTVIIASINDFATSGFDTTPFDINGANSYWKTGSRGIPSFTEPEDEVTVNVASVADITNALTTHTGKTINFNLTQDISYSGTGGNTLISTLNGVFNGNGHKITITASIPGGSDPTPRELLIGTIAETGVVQNLRLEYDLTVSGNAYHTTAFFGNNNGLIRNCDIKVKYVPGWHDAGYFQPIGGGSGTLENVILSVTIPDGGTLIGGSHEALVGGSVFKNVLVMILSDRDILSYVKTDSNAQKQNTVIIGSADDFATSGFDTSSFNTSLWNLDGVPTLKAPTV